MNYKTLFLFLLISFISIDLFAKSYKIDTVHIEAKIYPDGSMAVEETRYYNFKGSYSYAFRQFPKQEGIEVTEFRVMENGRELPFSEKEEKGHYVLIEKAKYTELGWAFEAKDEMKAFTISYLVNNIIQRHEDVAVLYFKFIDKQWKVDQSNVHITISFAGERDELAENRHWLHGPAHAYSEIGPAGEIQIHSSYVSKNSFLEVRALYPSDWFPSVRMLEGNIARDIMIEEKQWAEEANAKRSAAIARKATFDRIYQFAPLAVGGMFFLGLAISFLLYKNYRKDLSMVSRTNTLQVKPPSNLHPVFINFLIYGYNMGTEVNATLYKLAHEKFISIEDRNEDGKNSKKKLYWHLDRNFYEESKAGLFPFEVRLIDFLFNTAAKGKDQISFHEMSKSPYAYQKMLSDFNKLVSAEGKKMGMFDQESTKGRNIMVGLSFATFVLVFISVIFFKIWALWILLLLGIMLALTANFRQRHPKYQEEYYRWVSYRKYLKETLGRKSNREINYELINEHLIYGTVFGLTKNQVTKLFEAIPEQHFNQYLYWYIILYRSNMQPATLSKTLSHMPGNMSSGTGVGGGASFGGGGGFSAGGGGAR